MNMTEYIPSEKEIVDAHERIKGFIHQTPILTSKAINNIAGCELYFKCENFQKVGAFKMRGASNAVLSLSGDDLEKGVATHSSGNHAAALALAAKSMGVPAHIVMPRTAPEIKKAAVKEYGARIVFCESTLQAREETLENVVSETGATFIHPYDNYDIIKGQATCAKEVFEEIGKPDYIIAPAGGGGLLSGTCLSAEYFSQGTKVIGAEPSGADDMYRSIRDSKIYPSVNPNTIADGLLTSLSEKTYSIIKRFVDEIITVDDEQIKHAMKLIWERMKIVIEPSAAVPLAVVLNNNNLFVNRKVTLILSGGNADLSNLPW